MDEWLYEIKEDYELIRELNVNEKEIESQIYGWTKTDKENDYIPFF